MSIAQNLVTIQQRIDRAVKNNTNQQPVKLLAVSKTKPSAMIRQLAQAGQRSFGENYCQEAVKKQQELSDLDLEWHFIGAIQSNKTKDIANHFDWVHTLDRYMIAQRLSSQRPSRLAKLNVLIQVNTDNETSKSGVSNDEVLALAEKVIQLPNIALRGIMCIPAAKTNYQQQLKSFLEVSVLYNKMKKVFSSVNIDTLSMGMTNDLEAAIDAESNLVRIGEGLFGKR